MALIKSISGIRGTIGGLSGQGLTPEDIMKYTLAYGTWVKSRSESKKCTVVIGRDARLSGEMVKNIVCGALQGLGINIVDCGLSTTPTVEMMVTWEKAQGGIIITASHNPKQWNALKLLNEKGEFISAADGEMVLKLADSNQITYADVKDLGKYTSADDAIDRHIDAILKLKLVDKKAIAKANFKIVVDAVNSSGGFAVPKLLKALGVEQIIELNCEPTGEFAHNPEPLPEHLTDLSEAVLKNKAHLGISVDPDVDRLAFVCEDGDMFGEEYTLVAVADYVLKNQVGNTVSNLSSTRALKDVTLKYGGNYYSSAVGEVNVVEVMKANQASIGGEGNGGIIFPELHYGRDAMVGIALFLSHLAQFGKSISMLRAKFPKYFISKNKIELTDQTNTDLILKKIQKKYAKQPINTIDGVKIEFDTNWVHLRKSNTEPIIRIYSEADNSATADSLAHKIIADIKEINQSLLIGNEE